MRNILKNSLLYFIFSFIVLCSILYVLIYISDYSPQQAFGFLTAGYPLTTLQAKFAFIINSLLFEICISWIIQYFSQSNEILVCRFKGYKKTYRRLLYYVLLLNILYLIVTLLCLYLCSQVSFGKTVDYTFCPDGLLVLRSFFTYFLFIQIQIIFINLFSVKTAFSVHIISLFLWILLRNISYELSTCALSVSLLSSTFYCYKSFCVRRKI